MFNATFYYFVEESVIEQELINLAKITQTVNLSFLFMDFRARANTLQPVVSHFCLLSVGTVSVLLHNLTIFYWD